jgi:hypothetical protein
VKFYHETEIAEPVVQYLEQHHWEVYQEVSLGGATADIVAVQGPLLWVLECKLRFSLALLEQAEEWIGLSNLCSIVTPHRTRQVRGHRLGRRIMGILGIGHFEVGYSVQESVRPALRRKRSGRLQEALCPEHKTFCKAGSAGGGMWTPFKRTSRDIVRAVHRNPGLAFKEMMADLKHHYSTDASARACILRWIRAGVIEGVRLDEEMRLFPLDRSADHG